MWHQQLSHFGVDHIKEAAKLVDGLIITNENTAGQCKDCIVVNMKKRPYNGNLTPKNTVLRSTNIDLWGPACVKSAGGAVYVMKFHDRGSSH